MPPSHLVIAIRHLGSSAALTKGPAEKTTAASAARAKAFDPCIKESLRPSAWEFELLGLSILLEFGLLT